MLYWAIEGTFYAGTACYLIAGLLALGRISGRGADTLTRALQSLVAGAVLLAAMLGLRGLTWGLVPLTTMLDSISLFAVFTAIVTVYMLRKEQTHALLCFYAPPLAAACLINAMVAHGSLHAAPRALPGLPLTLHVGMVFLAYALFFLASMTSAAYLFQANRLKLRRTMGLFQRLPSLEQLDRSLWRLVVFGYPIFVTTLALGFVWAWLEHDLLEASWWMAPKVVLSCVTVVFYGLVFHLRRLGRLRGPKLSYVMFLGFILLLLAYMVMDMVHLRDYNFWETRG